MDGNDHDTVIWLVRKILELQADIQWIKAKLKGELEN